MKKLLLLGICLWALATQPGVAATPPDIIVVRIYGRTIIITRGAGKSESIEVDEGFSEKKMTQASEIYYKVFERLYQEGFTVQSTFTTVYDANRGFTTILFTKPH